MLKKIHDIKKVVHDLLVEFPECRDNDNLLACKVWGVQYSELKELKFNTFAYFFIRGRFADYESIRRSRQLIQSNNPSLRGNTHYSRRRAEMQMRDNLKLFKS
jgi:hypothetical protein